MTNKKRFNFVGGYLYDGNKPIGHVEDIKFRQDYEDIVNALHEENEQLKPFVEYEKRQHKHWKRECLENIKEIAQLKREIIQLKGDDVE